MNTTEMFLKGGAVVGGMLGSEVLSQTAADFIPLEHEHKGDFIQIAAGAGAMATLGRSGGKIGSVATYAGLGALVSGILGLLKMKVPYLAQAGEEDYYLEENGDEYALLGDESIVYIDEETGEVIASAGEELYIDEETGEIVALDSEEVPISTQGFNFGQPQAISV